MDRTLLDRALWIGIATCLAADFAAGAPVTFRKHRLAAKEDSSYEAAGAADFDKDGAIDIVCGEYLYRGPAWKERIKIREIVKDGRIREGLHDGYWHDFSDLPVDVDGDGWLDIVSVTWHEKDVAWVRNPGRAGGLWERKKVAEPGNSETAYFVDIDGDGKQDILPNIMQKVAWYEVKGGTLVEHVASAAGRGHGIGCGDIDGDGRKDLACAPGWLRAPEDPRTSEWAFEPWTDPDGKAFSIGSLGVPSIVADVDGDGRADLIFGEGHNYGIFWLRQIADDGARRWERRPVEEKGWSQAHALIWCDIDLDGAPELVTGKRKWAHNGHDPGGMEPPLVCYYELERDPVRWTRIDIDKGDAGFGLAPVVTDLDGDGDPDIVAPGKTGLFVFENLTNRR
ncbi:MAG: VCBS repeat-containing protein [Planctomycetes bacterium]|nr:VCBS repeat-containing protein [Planctomycetota bacterium]